MDNLSLVTEQVKHKLFDLRDLGLVSQAFRLEALKLLEKALSVDVSFLGTADPTTLLLTGGLFTDDLLRNVTMQLLENEILKDDFNKFSWLAKSKQLVGSLSIATSLQMTRSQRYREILEPIGLGDEIKAALVVNSSTWGFLCLHRERTGEAFSTDEIRMVRELIPCLADGLRLALLTDHTVGDTGPDGPGLLLLNDDLTIAGMNLAAEQWLAGVAANDWSFKNGLPFAVYAAVTHLQALEQGGVVVPNVRVPVRTAAGNWLILNASRFSGSNAQRHISVILEFARLPEVAPLIQQAYGLSKREQDIVHMVARGLSTAEISAQLYISVNTVQDHLKSIFDKVGVHSRGALIKQIFDHHYRT